MAKRWLSLKLLLALCISGKALDVITTLYLVGLHGPSIESNPFTANMLYAYGPVAGLIINACIHGMLMYLLYWYDRYWLLKVAAILTFVPPLTNFLTIWLEK